MLFTDKATIYNHYVDNGVDKWKRSVVEGVQWSHNKIETNVSGGTQTQSRVESITFDFTRIYKNNPMYVNPIEFANLTDKSGYWTLDSNNKLDVIVYGECTSEISASYKLANLIKDNQYVGTISAVSDDRNRTFLKIIKAVAK